MKYGFIGCGNMGGALARALTKTTRDVIISDPSAMAKEFALDMGCEYGSNEQAARCERVFLAVKPHIVEGALAQLRPVLKAHKPLLISMAAGVTIAQIEEWAGTELPVIRIMPNTPAAVGKGMITYCPNELVDDAALADFLNDMAPTGRKADRCRHRCHRLRPCFHVYVHRSHGRRRCRLRSAQSQGTVLCRRHHGRCCGNGAGNR